MRQTDRQSPRINWSEVEIVVIPPAPKARCPECGHDSHILVRSLRGGDGSTTRYAICRHCSEPLVIVVDPDEAW